MNSIKTPGFNAEKKFSFLDGGNYDGNSDDIRKVNDTSLEQSEVDDISSMASDFPKFRAKRQRKRATSLASGTSSLVSGTGSDSSSEMAAISDNDDDVREILRRHSVLRINKKDM